MHCILIVEDDPIVARIYQKVLERHDYGVVVVPDGQSGLAEVLACRPDGILLDLLLPQMSGIEFLREVRSYREFRNLPIMAYTNVYVSQLVEAAREAGATEVFSKSTLTPAILVGTFGVKFKMADTARSKRKAGGVAGRVKRVNGSPFTED